MVRDALLHFINTLLYYSGEEPVNKMKANVSDEEPLYDSVASDDDYAIAEEMVKT